MPHRQISRKADVLSLDAMPPSLNQPATAEVRQLTTSGIEMDRPGFLGGCDLWESWDSCNHGSSIPLSCGGLMFSELGLSELSGRNGHRDFRLSLPGQGRESEVDGLTAAAATVDLGEFVVGAGEADLESFDLAEPAFTFGFGDAGGEV